MDRKLPVRFPKDCFVIFVQYLNLTHRNIRLYTFVAGFWFCQLRALVLRCMLQAAFAVLSAFLALHPLPGRAFNKMLHTSNFTKLLSLVKS